MAIDETLCVYIGPTHAVRTLTFAIEPRYRIPGGAAIRVAPDASTSRLLSIGLTVVDVAVGKRRQAIALLHAPLVGIPAPVCQVSGLDLRMSSILPALGATCDLLEELVFSSDLRLPKSGSLRSERIALPSLVSDGSCAAARSTRR
jgi:hypothetical protein